MLKEAKAAQGLGPVCDCHTHIYGPYDRFPLPAGDTSPERTLADYRALSTRLGIARTVFVQPLAYRTDHGAMLAAMAEAGADHARGIAIVAPDTPEQELRALAAAGVKGLRIMTTEPGALGLADAPAIARRVAPLGWHLQIQGDGRDIANWPAVIAKLPTAVVIDHLGRLPLGGGIDGPAFRGLIALLGTGKVWLKLSALYYGLGDGNDWSEVALRVRRLTEARADRLVWGLNWPHPRFAIGNKPDDAAQFEEFLSWLPDEGLRRRILVENPARLYGFD
ncbi:amidohydrolase family protein [Bosea sp. (in: a-proteobacteria)]|uniref:amidohydrolase family protein n=1 Tax=Bosea sp. (in: a-proteobacteria) TaxID=1871050 RepID=UPI00262DFF35|nr:amidohydrolase family protein [Bosea sp. (in: a-proteobacteria)]MCO5089765.1 amidohydrolase family protein [Bosea sp. (in: a-proteobacteria)]